jgi:hypothetical protein
MLLAAWREISCTPGGTHSRRSVLLVCCSRMHLVSSDTPQFEFICEWVSESECIGI